MRRSWHILYTRVVLAASLVVFAASLFVYGSSPVLHARLAVASLLVFYAAVASSYVASASSGSRAVLLLGAIHTAAYALYAHTARLALTAGGLFGSLMVVTGLRASRGAPRFAVASLLPVYALSVWAGIGCGQSSIECLTKSLYAVPAAAVAPVNLYSLAMSFHTAPPLAAPSASLAYTALLLTAGSVGVAVFTAGYAVTVSTLLLKSLQSSVYQTAGWHARRGLRYLLEGQVVVAGTSLVHALVATFGPTSLEVHSLAMGYVASHIYAHAPLMLPAVAGLPASRRYTRIPYILLAVSLGARLSGLNVAAHALLALSLAALVYSTFRLRLR